MPRISSVRALPSSATAGSVMRPLSRTRICGSLTVRIQSRIEPSEGGDALVLHPVLGDVLRLGEEALEIAARLLVRSKERAIAREQVPALARLEVDHQPQELLGVVGQLQVVLHQPLELLLELLVGVVRARQTHAQDGNDQERAEEDAPEESALEDVQGFEPSPSGRKLSLASAVNDETAT